MLVVYFKTVNKTSSKNQIKRISLGAKKRKLRHISTSYVVSARHCDVNVTLKTSHTVERAVIRRVLPPRRLNLETASARGLNASVILDLCIFCFCVMIVYILKSTEPKYSKDRLTIGVICSYRLKSQLLRNSRCMTA